MTILKTNRGDIKRLEATPGTVGLRFKAGDSTAWEWAKPEHSPSAHKMKAVKGWWSDISGEIAVGLTFDPETRAFGIRVETEKHWPTVIIGQIKKGDTTPSRMMESTGARLDTVFHFWTRDDQRASVRICAKFCGIKNPRKDGDPGARLCVTITEGDQSTKIEAVCPMRDAGEAITRAFDFVELLGKVQD